MRGSFTDTIGSHPYGSRVSTTGPAEGVGADRIGESGEAMIPPNEKGGPKPAFFVATTAPRYCNNALIASMSLISTVPALCFSSSLSRMNWWRACE